MKSARLVFILLALYLLMSSHAVFAQGDSCPVIVETALNTVDSACEGTSRNQICYGNLRLEVEPHPGFSITGFSKQGDKTGVADIQRLLLTPMDTEIGEWGVALLRIQANLPDTLPGQNVTFLLFGDVEVSNPVTPQDTPVNVIVTAASSVNLRGGPSTNQPVVGSLGAGESITATGRLADGSWLRVELASGQSAWVFSQLVRSEEDLDSLNVVTAEETVTAPEFGPMQFFYFRSGVGDAPCREAPNSGILIQTPEGVGKINLFVNEVSITLSSTVYLQAQAPGEMIVNTIENQAVVKALDVERTVIEGGRVIIPLDENQAPSGPPGKVEAYDLADLQALPLQNLERPISLPPPLTAEQIAAANGANGLQSTLTPMPETTTTPPSSQQISFSDLRDDVVNCRTSNPVEDAQADMLGVIIQRSEGIFNAWVYMREPLVDDYSFAMLLILFEGPQKVAKIFLWEVHDEEFRIGELDVQTGKLIPDSQQRVTIVHDQERGIVSFTMRDNELPDTFSNLAARSFHTFSKDQETNCDIAGPYDVPR